MVRDTGIEVDSGREAVERLETGTEGNRIPSQKLALQRMRALLARADGDGDGDGQAFREYAERYRARAVCLGFEGHIATAETMFAAV